MTTFYQPKHDRIIIIIRIILLFTFDCDTFPRYYTNAMSPFIEIIQSETNLDFCFGGGGGEFLKIIFNIFE